MHQAQKIQLADEIFLLQANVLAYNLKRVMSILRFEPP
jgi:hypothetical protein